ncbi:MAG: hypothetical protein H7A51_08000 [Akkermansiaceae bacterium]|nr:hypothetical protein [Akkermansiaceae bacterium]
MTNTGYYPEKHQRCISSRGFALIATISVMVLLVMIALAMLTLSALELRSSGQDSAMAEARANARVSLMLALGQLQQEMGPDQRISAPSEIMDSTPDTPAADGVGRLHYTGVWTAAESLLEQGTLHQPSYDKKSGFRKWLVSGDPVSLAQMDLVKTALNTGPNAASMVAAGSATSSNRGVTVPLVEGTRSAFAWWTSDNGTKATLRAGEKPDPASIGKSLLGLHRPSAEGHAALNTDLPTRDEGLDSRLVDLQTVDAAKPITAREDRVGWKNIHDLSTQSEIIPVDVTNGGFRKCMNLKLDWLQGLSASQRAAQGTVGPMKNAYSDYRLFSWDQLRNYESLARSNTNLTIDSATGRPTVRVHKQQGYSGSNGEPEWNPYIAEDRFRLQPVILKFGLAMSYATEHVTNTSKVPDPSKPYALNLYTYPILALWNPYNVDLLIPEYISSADLPLRLNFEVRGTTNRTYSLDLTGKNTEVFTGFGPEMGGIERFSNITIPAGSTAVLYGQRVRTDYAHRNEHRHYRFRYHYYIWGKLGDFTLGEGGNFGGVMKHLNNGAIENLDSGGSDEIWGSSTDTVKLTAKPAEGSLDYRFRVIAEHTDWWGNNGSGTDNAETLQKFGVTCQDNMQVEAGGRSPQISLLTASEAPQHTFGALKDTPTPVLYFEYYRKPADEDLFPSKTFSFSVAGNPIYPHTSSKTGNSDTVTPWFEKPYSFRFKAISSWFDVTKTFQLPPDSDKHIYFGNSYSPAGQLNVVDQEIPLSPLVSLGQLQHLPLFDYRPTYDPIISYGNTIWYTKQGAYWFHEGRVTQFAQNHAIGNSYASPGIPADKLTYQGWNYRFSTSSQARHLRTDRSYMANAVLWDSWFCSSVAAQDGLLLTRDISPRNSREVARDFFEGDTPLPNDMMTADLDKPAGEVLDELFQADGKPKAEAVDRIAEYIRISGGFNINSVSEVAWTHFLAGLFSRPVLVMESKTGTEKPRLVQPDGYDSFLISRNTLSNAEPAERKQGKAREDSYWNGSREINADQLKELAAAIVKQVKKRGPFLSLAEFVNRRVTTDKELAISGALQSALDDDDCSINEPFRYDVITGNESTTAGKPSYPFPDAAKGPRRQGINGYVTQADLLNSIGPMISPRSDTFTIRAMGESRDTSGKVLATAWCEAVVQRTADYLNSGDPAWTDADSLTRQENQSFGRRFKVVTFRWLHPGEAR